MPRVEVVSVIDGVTADLRRRVLTGELPAEHPLAEIDVAEYYDVARSTAKAAIENVVRERLLVRNAHKTARVVRLTGADAGDIYLSRQLIEMGTVQQLAARRYVPEGARAANSRIGALVDADPMAVVTPDMEFHTALVDALGSSRTSRLYGSLVSEVVLCMSQVQGASLLSTAAIADEHAAILESIERGDGEAAAALVADHIGRARDRLAARLDGVE